MRNCVNLVVASVTLMDPGSSADWRGEWLFAVLACWSLYRILTRSLHRLPVAVDYGLVLAVCVSIPAMVHDPQFYSSNTAPQAIAGTAVVSFAVSAPPLVSFLMTVGIAAGYAWGSAEILGWSHLGPVIALYYFALQWITAAMVRFVLLRIATTVDRTRTARAAAEVNHQVGEAVRHYEREQLALLHDTAASTLLIIGQGGRLPAQRLASQARRDLELLAESPWEAPPSRVELIGALRKCIAHMSTPSHLDGCDRLWLDGEDAKAIIAAFREAINNIDRHAEATEVAITVTDQSVVVTDNGVGFDPQEPRTGHGVTDSILGRMHRAGGFAVITSSPGKGTTTELRWAQAASESEIVLPADPDRFIERARARYGFALVAYALANLAVSVPHATLTVGHSVLNAALGVVAFASTLAAVPAIRHGRTRPAWAAAAAMLAVTVLQPLLLDTDRLGGYAHWSQGAIGWCLLPLLLGLSTRTGAAILIAYWAVGAAVEFISNPTTATLVNIGLGSASILGVQLFALVFNGLMRDAAAAAQVEVNAHKRIALRELVERALRAEYQLRYAQLVNNVVPLLQALADGAVVDEQLQVQSRVQSRKLRALFDQAATFEHPFMQAVRPLVDEAEARHVGVTVDLGGEIPELPSADIDALLRPVADLIKRTNDSARIVVSCSAQEVSVSVVCSGLARLPDLSEDPRVEFDSVGAGDTVWLLVRRNPSAQGARSHALVG
ncbi:Signal transduction histidine kinase-like protein [uncultured Mycobacterium sp.]|uniref:Signal transduction histidine kinase-like protein n=1 Tax=uncultured Mycobacterium sp. TaxID=171292 RepID=A0A1Y5PHU6_9MYCO|nr:Signal transduction histidine kinase-like protein [uncultured Mycobacterium sp.]